MQKITKLFDWLAYWFKPIVAVWFSWLVYLNGWWFLWAGGWLPGACDGGTQNYKLFFGL